MQFLQRIPLEQFVPNKILEDNYENENLQADEVLFIPQDDVHTISLELRFRELLENAFSKDWTRLSMRTSVGNPNILALRERTDSTIAERNDAADDITLQRTMTKWQTVDELTL